MRRFYRRGNILKPPLAIDRTLVRMVEDRSVETNDGEIRRPSFQRGITSKITGLRTGLVMAEVRVSRTHRRPLKTTAGFEDREGHRSPRTSVPDR
jgi:hypothetical protein